ncbi:ArnT family glycosyltransferase [Lewinella sp. IMCC34183]|uniref:ArnT family glycosyltransferase n=1 Tax=Lewinella sp. IMCC34183 TaxID=2248762 RepID=UPI000E2529A7|nr:hypothetical protein [Lewinella sp. IMCC34183]
MKGKLAVLAVAVGVLLAHHYWAFYGHFGFDDLYYAELAQRLLHGSWDPTDHYSYRIVPLTCWATSYAIFGIGDHASALPAFLATVALLSVLLYALRDRPTWQYALAVAFFFGMRWNLFYSDKLMPDVFVGLFSAVAWTAYVTQRTEGSTRGAALAAVSLFLAFNSKGTVILLVPLFLWYFVLDVRNGRLRWWGRLLVVLLPLLAVYFTIIWSLTGSPLSRFTAITANHYLNPCSYDVLPWPHLRERLTGGFLSLLTQAYLLPHLFIAAGALIYYAVRRTRDRRAYFFPLTVVICLLSINFMSISLTSYNPICLDPRHLLLFSPILAISSVLTLADLLRRSRMQPRGWSFYVPLTLLIVALLTPAAAGARYDRSLEYERVKPALEDIIAALPRPATVYGSQVLVNYGRYYTAFADTDLTFRLLDELPPCTVDAAADTATFLVRNWYTDWHSGGVSTDVAGITTARGVILEPTSLGNERVSVEQIACP